MGKFIDLTGRRFERLTVVRQVGHQGKQILWECVCDCGITTVVRGDQLRNGATKSCGCYHVDKLREMIKSGKMNHGKHHDTGKRLYRIWNSMKGRCNNQNHVYYSLYGGRNIKVCDEWETDFSLFKAWALSNGYDDTKSIDRIDNNQGYCPDNCRWIPIRDQPKNRRTNHLVTVNGETMTVSECSRRSGIPISTLVFRANRNRDLFEKRRRW